MDVDVLLKTFTCSTIVIPSRVIIVTTGSAVKIAVGIVVLIVTPGILSPVWVHTPSKWVGVPGMGKIIHFSNKKILERKKKHFLTSSEKNNVLNTSQVLIADGVQHNEYDENYQVPFF